MREDSPELSTPRRRRYVWIWLRRQAKKVCGQRTPCVYPECSFNTNRLFPLSIPLDFFAEESVHACRDRTSAIALAWPFGRALGGGSAGNGPMHLNGGSHVKNRTNRQA